MYRCCPLQQEDLMTSVHRAYASCYYAPVAFVGGPAVDDDLAASAP